MCAEQKYLENWEFWWTSNLGYLFSFQSAWVLLWKSFDELHLIIVCFVELHLIGIQLFILLVSMIFPDMNTKQYNHIFLQIIFL